MSGCTPEMKRGFGSGGHAKFAVDMMEVGLNGLGTDEKFGGDF